MASSQHRVSEVGTGLDQMLTIVEDDQQLPLAQEVEQRRKQRLVWLLPQTQGSGNGARHKRSVSQGRKFDKPSERCITSNRGR